MVVSLLCSRCLMPLLEPLAAYRPGSRSLLTQYSLPGSQRKHPQCLPDPVTHLKTYPVLGPGGTLPNLAVRARLGVDTLGCSQHPVTHLVGRGTRKCIWSSSKGTHHHHQFAPTHPCPRAFRLPGFCLDCPHYPLYPVLTSSSLV